jgi:hypothetical protein
VPSPPFPPVELDTNPLNRALGLDAPSLLARANALSTDRAGATHNAILECWIENEWNSFSSDRREFAMREIPIRRPRPARTIPAGPATDVGAFEGPPPIALPLLWPACDQMHGSIRRTPGPQTFPSSSGAKT